MTTLEGLTRLERATHFLKETNACSPKLDKAHFLLRRTEDPRFGKEQKLSNGSLQIPFKWLNVLFPEVVVSRLMLFSFLVPHTHERTRNKQQKTRLQRTVSDRGRVSLNKSYCLESAMLCAGFILSFSCHHIGYRGKSC